jgi:hypothetical protein
VTLLAIEGFEGRQLAANITVVPGLVLNSYAEVAAGIGRNGNGVRQTGGNPGLISWNIITTNKTMFFCFAVYVPLVSSMI